MYSFKNDYSTGAHPNILNRIIETNLDSQPGYGDDDYSTEAKALLRDKTGNPDARIFFLSGGTQTNLIALSFLLRVHEAVISAKTGHISSNETGAVEATGHKVIAVESADGKLNQELVQSALDEYALQPHVVKPRVVFISNSTEIGSVYSHSELKKLSEFCKEKKLMLYLDGARLGHALTAPGTDVSLKDIAALTDVFYIGGTKNGALLGEALVFTDSALAEDFEFSLKQKGAMLAKGRLLAIQFLELFKDDLYFELAAHANQMAMKIADVIRKKGFNFLTEPASNQIFPILPNAVIRELEKKYLFYVWKKMDEDHSAVRLITSWSSTEPEVEAFIDDFMKLTAS